MVAPTVVDTPTHTVDCTCEKDCDDCDDAEVPPMVGVVIVFKALPLLKCTHKQEYFQKVFTKNSYRFPYKQFSHEQLKQFEKSLKFLPKNFKNGQTTSQ